MLDGLRKFGDVLIKAFHKVKQVFMVVCELLRYLLTYCVILTVSFVSQMQPAGVNPFYMAFACWVNVYRPMLSVHTSSTQGEPCNPNPNPIGVDLAGLLGEDAWRAPKVGYGEGCPLSSRLGSGGAS